MIYNFPFYPQYGGRMYSRYPQSRYINVDNPASKAQSYANNKSFNKTSLNNYNVNNRENKENRKISNNKKDDFNNKDRNSSYSENVLFEIFGIKLHYDDILLICLIFFLYKEGVKDESLFISLILLLLS